MVPVPVPVLYPVHGTCTVPGTYTGKITVTSIPYTQVAKSYLFSEFVFVFKTVRALVQYR